jgi:hypothetical protein
MVRGGGHGEEEGLDGEGAQGKGEEAEKDMPAVELAVEKTDAQAQVFLPFLSLSPPPLRLSPPLRSPIYPCSPLLRIQNSNLVMW